MDPLTIELSSGAHVTRESGTCLLEAVAWFAGEAHSDAPQCVCPVLARFGINLNDRFRVEERQLLRPLIPLLVGTRSTPEVAQRRAFFLVDRAVRLFAPMALDATNQRELAEEMRAIPPIVDRPTALAAREVAWSVRDRARAAAYAADAAYAAYAADAAYAYAADAAYAAYAYAADADAARKPIVEAAIGVFRQAIAITE